MLFMAEGCDKGGDKGGERGLHAGERMSKLQGQARRLPHLHLFGSDFRAASPHIQGERSA